MRRSAYTARTRLSAPTASTPPPEAPAFQDPILGALSASPELDTGGQPPAGQDTSSYRESGLTVPSSRASPVQSITITEAARRLGVSPKTVRRRIATGELAAHKATGPGGFQYRVTDPRVLVVRAGQPNLDTPRDSVDKRERTSVDTGVLASLTQLLADSEAERRRLSLLLEQAQRALPAPT